MEAINTHRQSEVLCPHYMFEIGKLKKALLHCPGSETRNYPDGQFNQVFTLRPSSSSFDLEKALKEHHAYSTMLEREGVEILYLENLLTEALDATDQARRSFIDSFIRECGACGIELESAIRDYLEHIEGSRALAQAAVNGIRYSQVFDTGVSTSMRLMRFLGILDTDKEIFSLAKLTGDAYSPDDLLVSPLNTMWFTRDPASVIGEGVTLNHMYWPERNREVIAYKTIFTYHPDFREAPQFFKHESTYHFEGGDLHNLTCENVAVGISQRTEPAAIDTLANNLLWDENSAIESVWAIQVPYDDLCIHLDTYFARVGYETFLVDRELLDQARVYRITREGQPGRVMSKAV